jgi:hypothetical protein
MKKIAFFVEGQTEQVFINQLLREIATQKDIAITLYKLEGGSSVPKRETIVPQSYTNPINPKYEALIYDCGNDEKVKSDILENMPNLATRGYSEILGIRDLFPITDLARLERGLQFVPRNLLPLPIPYTIIVAVNEIEAWFLAECNHFQCIDPLLTHELILKKVGFDPCTDDMTLLTQPAEDLKTIYQLVGKTYNKKKNNIERTVSCLDYANLYLNLSQKITKLKMLIAKIDAFLT